MRTALAWVPTLASRRCGGGRKSSSDPSPIISIEAACAGLGFADCQNVHKRYLVHVAGHNLGILMRLLIGAGTPREAAARALAYVLFFYTAEAVTVVLVAASYDGFAVVVMAVVGIQKRQRRRGHHVHQRHQQANPIRQRQSQPNAADATARATIPE